jgi:hypothetical protein
LIEQLQWRQQQTLIKIKMRLPETVQEIADVIGVERALYLVGKLPRCYVNGKSGGSWATGKRVQSERLVMYVPKVLKPDSDLVRILGWADAYKLTREFGGLILYPANCAGIYRQFRNENIKRLASEGVPVRMLSEWFDMSERSIKDLIREIPQEDAAAASQENWAFQHKQKGRTNASNLQHHAA